MEFGRSNCSGSSSLASCTQYEENAEIQEYFKAQLDVMRQSATVFDLGAILIKPVQRILKYPLLLNELIKVRCDD